MRVTSNGRIVEVFSVAGRPWKMRYGNQFTSQLGCTQGFTSGRTGRVYTGAENVLHHPRFLDSTRSTLGVRECINVLSGTQIS